MINVTPPESVLRGLEKAELNHRPVLLNTCTDITLEGDRQPQWLIVTNDHVNLLEEEGSVLQSIPVKDPAQYRTQAGVGSGVLQFQKEGVWFDLLRYSNALADRFFKVAAQLEQLREEGKIESKPEDEVDSHRCPKCQLKLPVANETCPRCLPRGAIFSWVGELLRPHLKMTILLCVLTVLGVIAELVPPKLQQYMVDQVLAVGSANSAARSTVQSFFIALMIVVGALAGSRLFLAIVGAFKGKLATRIGANLTFDLRAKLVARLQQLAVSYYDKHHVGSLMGRVAYDSEVLHGLVHQLTGGFLLQIVQLVGVGVMLFVLNPTLAFYTLIPVPLVVGGTWYFWQRVYPRYYRFWDSSTKQVQALSSMLAGIRVVKAFAQEPREFERFKQSSEYLRSTRLWVEESSANYSAWMSLIFSLGGLIVWYVGGRDVISTHMTLGELIAFLGYLGMFYAPLGGLSQFTTWLTSFLTGSKRVMELLEAPVAVKEVAEPVKLGDDFKGDITFENVTFGYDRHQPVIKGISFSVKPGEMIGVVGRSGSGKTTLVNLLGRFYDVDEGRVLVDGIDIKQCAMSDLRKRIGIVLQESYLFRGPIWDNLCYGNPEVRLEQGISAAKAAAAHDFILRTSLGYETYLGEHGAGLSGGEKQRLSLARALLYDPQILVLDEATSNVDTEAEKGIQEALERLTEGRTTIAIAHRLSTLRNADRILVFDRGKLIEHGSHPELLEKNGTYAKLVKIQTQLTKDPNVDQLVQEKEEKEEKPKHLVASHEVKQVVEKSNDGNPLPHELRWLDPKTTRFETNGTNAVKLMIKEAAHLLSPTPLSQGESREEYPSVWAVMAFPASKPDGYLSIRYWDEQGDDKEVGMIRDLAEWPMATQELLKKLISRHYLFRRIQSIEELKLSHGHLWFTIRCDAGMESFAMRWSQSQALDFGKNGKLLIDVEDRRYVIMNLEGLPKGQLEKFRRYVYW